MTSDETDDIYTDNSDNFSLMPTTDDVWPHYDFGMPIAICRYESAFLEINSRFSSK